MTGTWDPILLLLPSRPSSLSFCPPPLVATCIPLTLEPDSHPLTRLDSSLVSLLSSSFPSPVDDPLPLPTYLRSPSPLPFFLRRRYPSTRTYLPEHSPLSKHYFSSATNAKLKRILLSSILSVNMPV